MKRSKDLLKNTIILFFGSFLPKLTLLITLPILTGVLNKEEYGIYDFIITLVSLLLPAATLQVQSAAFRFLIDCRHDEKEQSMIVTNIVLFTIIVSTAILTILFFCITKIDFYLKLFVAFYYLLDILMIVMQQVLRGIGKNISYTISSLINSTLSMILVFIFLKKLNMGLNGAVLSLLISTAITNIYIIASSRILKLIKFSSISKRKLSELLSYSWPMVPNNLSGWVLNLSDRIVITTFIGIKANAIYAVANKLPNLLGIAKNTFIFAWQENATMALKDSDREEYYSYIFDRIIRILVGIMALLLAFTPIMFKLLIHANYEESYIHIPILYFGMLFSCIASFIGGIYLAYKKTKNVGITTTIAAICNLILDLSLVKFIGIFAGSISTMISYLLLLIYRLVDVQKFQKIKINIKKYLLYLLLLILMSIFCTYQNIYVNIINIAIGVFIAFAFNKNIVKEYYIILKKKLGGYKNG